MSRASDRAAVGRAVSRAFESGVPQQLIQIGGNLAVSLVQAGANNPLYAGMVGVAGANIGRGLRVYSDVEATAIKAAAGGFVVAKLASEAGGVASKTVSYANTYDVPDVQVPRLPPRPPLISEVLPQRPTFPRQPRLPSPTPTPFPRVVEEPIVVPVEPIELPEPLVPPTVPFEDPTGSPVSAEPTGAPFEDPAAAPFSGAQPTAVPFETREAEIIAAAGLGGAAAAAAAGGRPAFGGFGVTGLGVRRDVPTISAPQ